MSVNLGTAEEYAGVEPVAIVKPVVVMKARHPMQANTEDAAAVMLLSR